MDAKSIASMLREDQSEWERLTKLLEEHPGESLRGESSPAWNARDVYAHFARWIGRSTDDLEARLQGRTLPPLKGSDDEINARWQAKDSGLTLSEARERAQAAFERRIRAIQAVPGDRWDPILEAVARADGSKHYAAHRRYITGG